MRSSERIDSLRRLLGERIVVLDGAMGTSIQQRELAAEDFGGAELEGCNEYLVVSRPDVVESIHRDFLAAGADIVETDSFGSTSVVLEEYGMADRARELNRCAAEIARAAADAAATPERPRFVAGSMGPTTKTISVTGGIGWRELADAYREQALGLIEGGADLLLVETCQDTLNIKAALEGIDRANAELAAQVPVAVQGTVETMGTLLAGQDVEALYVSLAHRDLLWIGLNCATGPDFMTDHLRTLARLSRFSVACLPNAGLPDEDGNYNETPEMLAGKLAAFAEQGWVNVVGGCCGTVPEHIERIAEAVRGKPPRQADAPRRSVVSGIEAYEIDDEKRPVIVGERTNVLGSRKFKRLIAEGAWEEAAEVGRAQVRKGAAIVDVCLQDPDRDERADLTRFLDILVKKVRAPIMIDSTDPEVIEEALERLQGKAIINSINLEEGEAKFEAVVPLVKRFGAAVVVGCIDDDPEQAQAVTRQRKLEVAKRSYELLTGGPYGLAPEDLIFDPLVFPIGTGDENYAGSGVEVIEGVRLIKQAFPRAKTILGISNVSFGLPPAGREVLNSVFLHYCVEAGLDLAIVNAEALAPYGRIGEDERALCDDLIWWRGKDPVAAFAEHFAGKKKGPSVDERASLTLDERLALCVLEGSKEGLVEDLEEARKTRRPLEIINGPLMAGMDEVGRRFNANEMIVAEVLQSAETMKAAVAHLEQYMEKSETSSRGRIVLATVKGDVHDIGKNLVEIILKNNGFEVVNLGIKVPPEDLIRACREHQPDAIGLSGLLVKSAQQMVVTARDLAAQGIACPLLVGGAALSNRFTRLRIAPEYAGLVAYAKDAMTGLDLAKRLESEQSRGELAERLAREGRELAAADQRRAERSQAAPTAPVARSLPAAAEIPQPPDLKRHVIENYDLAEVFDYINPAMLYTRHLGFKGKFDEALAAGDDKAAELARQVEEVEAELLSTGEIRAQAVYRFFPAASEDTRLVLLESDFKTEAGGFEFGRQQREGGLCLSDFVAARGEGRRDYVALLATTIGPGVRELAERRKGEGAYLRSHIVQALAIEAAEAMAELLHAKIRAMWGFADPPAVSKKDLFQARYRGVRVSFGYPACPRLEDQAELFRVLGVEEAIGVKLTEGFMMDPESSVTALVFHHPEARYFSLTEEDQRLLEERIAARGEPDR